jgi:hypothetical protein
VGRRRISPRYRRGGRLIVTIEAWRPLDECVSIFPYYMRVVALTVLARQSTSVRGHVGIDSLGLLLGKLRDIIPVLLQTVCDLIRGLRVTQFQDRVVVHRPILGLLIGAPDLFSLNAKDLHADSTWCRRGVWNDLRGERRVAHDAVVAGGLGKHALGEVWWEVFVDDELADDTLRFWSVNRSQTYDKCSTHALSLEMCATETVHVLIEI